jgi:hypothetical protein
MIQTSHSGNSCRVRFLAFFAGVRGNPCGTALAGGHGLNQSGDLSERNGNGVPAVKGRPPDHVIA